MINKYCEYINKYTERVLLENGLNALEEIAHLPVNMFDPTDIPGFVNLLFHQPEKRVIVITSDFSIKRIVDAANTRLPKKAFIIYGENFECDEAIEQIEYDLKKLVSHTDMTEYGIMEELVPDEVYLLDNGNVVVSNDYCTSRFNEHLFSRDGASSYTILSGLEYVGSCRSIVQNEDIRLRAIVAHSAAAAVKEAHCSIHITPDAPIFKEKDRDNYSIFFKGEDDNAIDVYNMNMKLAGLIFYIFTGCTVDDDNDCLADIVFGVTHAKYLYPDYILDDFEEALMTKHMVSADKWLNTTERILLELKDGLIFKEKSNEPHKYTPSYIIIEDNIDPSEEE